jgi:hypothetical protein
MAGIKAAPCLGSAPRHWIVWLILSSRMAAGLARRPRPALSFSADRPLESPKKDGSGHAPPLVYQSEPNEFRMLVIICTLLSEQVGLHHQCG